MAPPSRIKLIAFDLGGVLVQVDKKVPQAFFESSDFGCLTLGDITPAHYFSRISSLLNLSIGQIEKQFRSMVTGIPASREILRRLTVPFTFWSNINVCHFEHLIENEPDLRRYQARTRVLSYEIHEKKPTLAFFKRGLENACVVPKNILFLDDCVHNVKAARELGIEAEHVLDLGCVLAALIQRDLISMPKGLSLLE